MSLKYHVLHFIVKDIEKQMENSNAKAVAYPSIPAKVSELREEAHRNRQWQ